MCPLGVSHMDVFFFFLDGKEKEKFGSCFCCVFCRRVGTRASSTSACEVWLVEKVVRGHTWVWLIHHVMQRTSLTPPQKYNAAREMTSARREDKLWEVTRSQMSAGCHSAPWHLECHSDSAWHVSGWAGRPQVNCWVTPHSRKKDMMKRNRR